VDERYVDADGFHIRYLEAGTGEPLVYLHGAGGLRVSPALERLSQHFHLYAFEQPGFGTSPENTRSTSIQDLAASMGQAVAAVGLDHFNLMGTSFGGATALWLTVQMPEQVTALVLESPAAVRPANHVRPASSPEQRAALLYAHPERVPAREPLPQAVVDQQERLVRRLAGANRDPDLEQHLRRLPVPTLVLFGTRDALIPPSMGRVYCELIPNCHFVLVYDAGHAIGFDRPEAFVGVVTDFLERHEAFVVQQESALINP
jgi:4,5:9,10-diseco-3-hydroxy-5,9,17-trioxoandrosta-1(10),2-diene-4-oate hydrolase